MAKYELNPTIAVEIRHLDRARSFYSEVLGLTHRGESGGEICYSSGPLNLLFSESGRSDVWFALDTDDLDGAVTELKAAGCEIGPASDGDAGVLVRDPFGFNFYLAPKATA